MVRKRYYCEYCDRSFPDSKEGRQKHMGGIHHQKMRKQHYDAFRDPQTAYSEELAKKPCHRFFRGDGCAFGANCKYSHFSEEDFAQLQSQIAEERASKTSIPFQMMSGENPSVETWLKSRRKADDTEGDGNDVPCKLQTEWKLPLSLQHYENLPPSLKPPQLQDFSEVQFTDWG